ncbi:hypothetical protein C1645_778724 [Glomus cerebriforme]|uniref:Uncharacterized protein n=1 Tax=Glomus cerebriforme TaxID=658196 RepID=A0A397SQA0_9GLOM|nr:hypothetical protein C1645_778724 [Glomus cerebriforme]
MNFEKKLAERDSRVTDLERKLSERNSAVMDFEKQLADDRAHFKRIKDKMQFNERAKFTIYI